MSNVTSAFMLTCCKNVMRHACETRPFGAPLQTPPVSGAKKQKSHSYVIKVVLDIFNIIVGNNKNDSLKLMPPNIKNYNWKTDVVQIICNHLIVIFWMYPSYSDYSHLKTINLPWLSGRFSKVDTKGTSDPNTEMLAFYCLLLCWCWFQTPDFSYMPLKYFCNIC